MRQQRNLHFTMMAAAMIGSTLSIQAAGTATEENPMGTSAPRAPVWYIAKEKSMIDNVMVETGERIQYAGLPSDNLIPTDAEGEARRKEHDEADKSRVEKLIDDNKDGAIGDPDAFMKAFSKELAEQNAKRDAEMQALLQVNANLNATLSDLVGKLQPAPAPIPGTVEAAVATDAAAAEATETATQAAKAAKAKSAT